MNHNKSKKIMFLEDGIKYSFYTSLDYSKALLSILGRLLLHFIHSKVESTLSQIK